MKRAGKLVSFLCGLSALVLGSALSASAATATLKQTAKVDASNVDGSWKTDEITLPESQRKIVSSNIVHFDASLNAKATYLLNGKYGVFSGEIATSTRSNKSGLYNVKVYGDNKLLYRVKGLKTSGITKKFNINVAGVKKLRIETSNDGGYAYGFIYFVNAKLSGGRLALSDSSLTMEQKDSTYVTSTYYNARGKEADVAKSWKSSNPKVAKVSSKGKIVAVSAGVCTITCRTRDAVKYVKVVVKPTTVQGVKVLSRNRTNVQLQWNAVKGASYYQVEMYDPDLEEFALVKTVKGSIRSARITELERNTAYRFRVRAVLSTGGKRYYGNFSKKLSVRTAR